MRWAYHIITPGHDNTIGGLSIPTKTAGIFSPGRKLLLSPIWWNIAMSSHVYQANSNATGWSSCNSFTCYISSHATPKKCYSSSSGNPGGEAWKHFRILWLLLVLLCFLSCWKKLALVPMVPVFSKLLQGSRLLSTVPAMVFRISSAKFEAVPYQWAQDLWIWPHMSSYLLRQVSDHPWNVHPEQDGFHIVSTVSCLQNLTSALQPQPCAPVEPSL